MKPHLFAQRSGQQISLPNFRLAYLNVRNAYVIFKSPRHFWDQVGIPKNHERTTPYKIIPYDLVIPFWLTSLSMTARTFESISIDNFLKPWRTINVNQACHCVYIKFLVCAWMFWKQVLLKYTNKRAPTPIKTSPPIHHNEGNILVQGKHRGGQNKQIFVFISVALRHAPWKNVVLLRFAYLILKFANLL